MVGYAAQGPPSPPPHTIWTRSVLVCFMLPAIILSSLVNMISVFQPCQNRLAGRDHVFLARWKRVLIKCAPSVETIWVPPLPPSTQQMYGLMSLQAHSSSQANGHKKSTWNLRETRPGPRFVRNMCEHRDESLPVFWALSPSSNP